jgi:type IV pilus assembly protein PilO
MDINDLDFENIGSWPALHRGVLIFIVCALLSGAFFYYVTMPEIENLERVEAKELTLKDAFTTKAALAANLEAYRAQVADIHIIFESLLNKLPSNAEVARLLDDISFIGENNGLQFKSINWGVTKVLELSVEVPISIKVIGSYQELGKFSADIAALPRIVILDNLRLSKQKTGVMELNVVAKTYQYKENQK